jgi:beta-glucosidase
MGATFDRELVHKTASAISDEARAMYSAAVAKGYRQQYGGLTFWSPNVNIFRDPRWGRGQETYGEDPYLMSELGTAFVRGLQGDHPEYLKAAAGAKHFAVHSGPERLRHEFNAVASKKDMFETYFPAFEATVGAGVETVMCAYNSTNGDPACASNYLLQEVLRQKWNFRGHIVSDCWALVDFFSENGHKVVENETEAAALALESGVNLNCGSTYPALTDAVQQGLVTESLVDERLKTLLTTRFKLGMFDPPEENPYNQISTDVINSKEHRKLAREAAVKSIVMLKNNGVLPLENDLPTYFLTGPNASSIEALLGNYYGINNEIVTILEGLAGSLATGSQMRYEQGVLLDRENVNPIDWATGNAAASDVTFAVLGINSLLEGEEGASIASPHYGDRLDYNLPENQINYLRGLTEGHDNPVIAIVTGGSPMNLAKVQDLADAVLLVWYPGEEGGNAVADVVFGKESPSGKLPITFPKSLDQLPPYEDYSMEGRTYRYMSAEPLYPFGFGLSYTTFEYSDISLASNSIAQNESTTVEATITNTGDVAAEEVVQLYIRDLEASVKVPLQSLKEFKRVKVEPGASVPVQFEITPDMLKLVNEEGERVLEPGQFEIIIGGSAPIQRSRELGAPEPVKATLTVN